MILSTLWIVEFDVKRILFTQSPQSYHYVISKNFICKYEHIYLNKISNYYDN